MSSPGTACDFKQFCELMHKLTGCKGIQLDDDLIFKPELLTKRFFDCLNETLSGTPYTYLVGRDLQVTVFKP